MVNKVFGYGRISAKDQNDARQIMSFKDVSINERDVYIDKKSGRNFDREQ